MQFSLNILVFSLLYCSSLTFGVTEKQNSEPKAVVNMSIQEVQEKYTDSVMAIPGVEGIGIGKKGEDDCIIIFIGQISKENKKKLPKKLEGYPVNIKRTEKIKALPHNNPF